MVGFVKREIVFVIALAAAAVTAFFNPPSWEWVEAVDFRTIGLLFSLMGVSEGLKASGLFDAASSALLKRSGDTRRLSLLLVSAVFLSSMLFTNDVSLIMFVPFTISLLDREGEDEGLIIRLVVLETIAANLGSMTTPVGNPQNLYICSFFNVGAWPFFRTILPYSAASALLVLASWRLLLAGRKAIKPEEDCGHDTDMPRTAAYCVFLMLALLSVFRVLPWEILAGIEIIFLLLFDRRILLRIDYILLLTFVCFFIFSENMGTIEGVRNLLSGPMQIAPVAVSALVSQVISNVPAAILLSPFASSFEGVLVGTDIGGLGTPVASLASLISLKFYFARRGGMKGGYMALFLVLNFAMLAVLLVFSMIIS